MRQERDLRVLRRVVAHLFAANDFISVTQNQQPFFSSWNQAVLTNTPRIILMKGTFFVELSGEPEHQFDELMNVRNIFLGRENLVILNVGSQSCELVMQLTSAFLSDSLSSSFQASPGQV